tara:strand:+ start:8586 stop:8909 length:324 start_codon:yes stop_codon:yes gene_type:complete
MSVGQEIADMKALLRVGTDCALAGALRVDRTNISLWRRRGRVPARAQHRAQMIAQFGDMPAADSLERIAADVAVLGDRLQAGRTDPRIVTAMLDALADRARTLESAS